jgi:hypothetical protein
MLSVGKSNILVDHISLQVFDLVATFLETTRITNLCMRFAGPFPRNEVGHGNLAVNPFPSEVVEKSGFIVAFRAGHMAMARCLPGLNVACHLMAGTAEGRGLRNLESRSHKDQQHNERRDEQDLDCLTMSSNNAFDLVERVDPKSDYDAIPIPDCRH